MGLGVVGLEFDGGAAGGDGLIQLALARQGNAQIAVGLGKVGLEPDRGAQGRDGLIQLALLPEGIAQVAVIGRAVGRQGDGLPDQVHGNVIASHLGRDHAQEMQGIGVVGLDGENLAIELLGLL